MRIFIQLEDEKVTVIDPNKQPSDESVSMKPTAVIDDAISTEDVVKDTDTKKARAELKQEKKARKAQQVKEKQEAKARAKQAKLEKRAGRSRGLYFMTGLSFVLSLGALGGGGYLAWYGLQYFKTQSTLVSAQSNLAATQGGLEQNIQQLQGTMQTQQDELAVMIEQNKVLLNSLSAQLYALQQVENRSGTKINTLSRKVNTLESNARGQSYIEEVEYLLQQANLRLQVTHDVQGSLALMRRADQVLDAANDYNLVNVKTALAIDLAELEAVKDVSPRALWQKIQLIANKVPELTPVRTVYESPTIKAPAVDASQEAKEDWQVMALNALKDTWTQFISLFHISSNKERIIEKQLTSEQEKMMKQQITLLLSQSQLALMNSENEIYQESLQQAEQWIKQFFSFNTQLDQRLTTEISALSKINITPPLPNINNTLNMLQDYMVTLDMTVDEDAGTSEIIVEEPVSVGDAL